MVPGNLGLRPHMQRREPQLIFTGSVLCGPPWTQGDGGLGRSRLWALGHRLPLSLRRLLGERFLSPPAVCWRLCSTASGHSSGLSDSSVRSGVGLSPTGHPMTCTAVSWPLLSRCCHFFCVWDKDPGSWYLWLLVWIQKGTLTFPGQPWRAMALLWLVCLTACLFHLSTCQVLTHQFSGAFLVLYNSIIHLPTTV